MARAASGISREVVLALVTLAGLTSTAMRIALGTRSCKSPSRLATTSATKKLMPVALPPGRARLATNPSSTGSIPTPKTMGIVVVAALAASVAGAPPVEITATRRRTRSPMSGGRRSYWPSKVAPPTAETTASPDLQQFAAALASLRQSVDQLAAQVAAGQRQVTDDIQTCV